MCPSERLLPSLTVLAQLAEPSHGSTAYVPALILSTFRKRQKHIERSLEEKESL
ncbi:MAG: hypothetical protein OJF52_002887 [Nitrospira sp.]|nr:MAG: hypothetical protein OJF52_002887 [Nitrospira sp.]